MRRILMGLALVAAGATVRADYAGIEPALNYNDFVLNNFTQSGTDAGSQGPNNGMGVAVGGNFAPAGGGSFTVNGPVVVGGNYTNGGTTIGGNIYGYKDVAFSNETVNGTVYAGGNLTISGGGEPSGGEQYVGTASLPSYFSHATKVASVPHPVDFGTASSYLRDESTYLHSLSSASGVSFTLDGSNHILALSGSGSNFYDFRVTADQFSSANTFRINVSGLGGKTPTVVVDVVNGDGSVALKFPNITPSYSGVTNQYVLFNFSGKSPLDTNNAGIQGAVLAPYSDVLFRSGNINGTMIANNLSGSGESHAYKFLGNPNLPTTPRAVPEPGSIALLLVGGAGAGLAFRRKIRRA